MTKESMTWLTLPVDQLNPASYNPRKALKKGDKEYEKIKRSIQEFGYVEPIIVNYDMTIIGGHQRLTVLKDLGFTEVQCVQVHIEDENKVKALNVALNKITGIWNEELLADLMLDLQEADFDTDLTGFEFPEIEDLFNQVHDKSVKDDDEFDMDKALEESSFVQTGDIWLLGRHRLMCGDSTNAQDVRILLDGKKANTCITDPPYGCDYTGGTGMKIMNDNLKGDEFYQFLLSAFKNVYDHLVDGGSLYVFHSDAEKVNFYNATVDSGFHYSTTCIWVKNALVIGRMDYQMKHEPVIYAFKDTARHKFYGDRKQTTVWEFDKPTKSKLHPTMKPLPLIAYPMKNSTQVNGVVLDLFGGSGSTLMAAEQLDRIAYLMELDPKYATAIIKRYANYCRSSEGISVIRGGKQLAISEITTLDFEEVADEVDLY